MVGPLIDEIESVARLGSYSLDIESGRWASSPGLDAIFGIDAAYDRSVAGWGALVHPDDRAGMLAYFADEVVARRQAFDREYRIVRADTAAERWVQGRGRLELDGSGRPIRMLGTIVDITEQRWALEALTRSELRYATIFDGTSEAILIADQATTRFRWVNAAATALLGYPRDELVRLTVRDIHPPEALPAVLDAFDAMRAGPGVARSIPCLRKDGRVVLADIRSSPVEVDGLPCLVGFFSDVTEMHRLEAQDRTLQAERERLVAAVEQTSDSVIVTDPAGAIEYVNPAFERISGYRREEVLGQNPRILKSGRQSAGFYRALWRRLTRGQSWTGPLINRRKGGTLYEEEATISPIRGPGGEVSGYVAVKRDVTAERAAESALAAEFRERAQVAAALARLQPSPTAEETAAEISGELFSLPGIDFAAILDFTEPGRAVALALGGPDGLPVDRGQALPNSRAGYLYGRASQGPWAEAWRARPGDGLYGTTLTRLGLKAAAYAPIRNGDGLLGLVAAGTRDDAYARHMIDHLPAVGEFAATASALLSSHLEWGHRSDLMKGRISRVLADRSFSPVFQPVFALASTEPMGYEALTRFADGRRPDLVIAEANSVDLGRELELATLAAALAASEALPPHCWLSLNVSPDVILHADELAMLLRGRSRGIVLEVTEHVEIDDYRAVRQALAGLGRTVSLAVDDAGAGFASLRHVVELRPQFLKLDLSLVRNVDRDPTRQAMVAGLTQFAQRVRCEVIAEGIEEQAELDMLRELGVPLGQGYLLGHPEPAAGSLQGRG